MIHDHKTKYNRKGKFWFCIIKDCQFKHYKTSDTLSIADTKEKNENEI